MLAAIISNPLTGQYVLQALDWVFQQMFIQGAWVSLVAGVYIIGYMAVNIVKSERTNVPAKSAKTKAQKYLVTK